MDVLTLAMAKAYSDSKGGYTKSRIEQILPEATHNFELQDGFAMVMIERNAVLYEGQSCTVLWDGKTYNCNVFVVEESTVIGNAGIFTGESGGEEPFFISFEEGVIVLVAEIAGEHTVSVTTTTETIVPIDQKYLPYDGEGVRIPRVLCDEGYILSEMEYLTVTDNPVYKTYEKLEYAANNNLPILFNIMIDFGGGFQTLGLLMQLQLSHDRVEQLFTASVGPVLLQLVKVWSGDQYSWEFSQITL